MNERAFEFLLNAMERAASSGDPAGNDYAAKRKAVFDYVRRLEVIEREAKALADIEYDLNKVREALSLTRRRTQHATAEDY